MACRIKRKGERTKERFAGNFRLCATGTGILPTHAAQTLRICCALKIPRIDSFFDVRETNKNPFVSSNSGKTERKWLETMGTEGLNFFFNGKEVETKENE